MQLDICFVVWWGVDVFVTETACTASGHTTNARDLGYGDGCDCGTWALSQGTAIWMMGICGSRLYLANTQW